MAVSLVLQQLASAATTLSVGTPATRSFTQITVAAGDRLAVQGRTEDNAFKYTAVTSSAGTAVTSAWTLARDASTSSHCSNMLYTATVTTGGTLTVSATVTATSGSNPRNGATLIVATNAAATVSAMTTTARQLSYLTTGASSAVFSFTTDWTAAASNGATFVPSTFGQVIDVRATDGVDQQTTAGANSSIFNAHWTDTSTVATTTYGLSSPSAGTYNTIILEFTDAGGAVAATFDNKLMAPIRRY